MEFVVGKGVGTVCYSSIYQSSKQLTIIAAFVCDYGGFVMKIDLLAISGDSFHLRQFIEDYLFIFILFHFVSFFTMSCNQFKSKVIGIVE